MESKYLLLLILFIFFLPACNEGILEEEDVNNKNLKANIQFASDVQNVSVLIFDENKYNGKFIYNKMANINWPNSNTTSTNLEFGHYKFLFIKHNPDSSEIKPTQLIKGSTQFEDIQISAKKDTIQNYVKPVDEIFLPETVNLANKTYSIQGNALIKNKLTRVVSQIKLKVKRGIWENGQLIDSIPYTGGKNILEHINKIEMDIHGVGEYVTINGSYGEKNMLTHLDNKEGIIISKTGFAYFNGPFLFPTQENSSTSISFKFIPKENSPYPIMNQTLNITLEKNKKTEITLWLNSTYKDFNITVVTTPINEEQEGEVGLWQ